ncbi:MAG: DUF86 domain-containing protein [Deltaproteobacteria bacterium]|jgi:uncharacterized protein with HEPN domain|nr:DUF86 domain-containing protein [Deltaproteobacteria bacterium]
MVSIRDANIIKHIDSYCDEIRECISWFKNPFEAILKYHWFKDCLAMKLYQISESAQHLTDDFTKEHGNMPWRTIKGLRVVYAHRYKTLDLEQMWGTIPDGIPELKQFCRDIAIESKY